MKYGKAAITLFLISVVHATTDHGGSKNRSLRWITNTAALNYLTVEMSDMESFKSSVLHSLVVERVPGTSGSKSVQKHIKSLLNTWHIEEDTFNDLTPLGLKEFTNIIATFNPNKPRKVVLACHFDSKHMPRKFVAASDSAVPCGILLETAKQLQCLLDKGPKTKSSAKDLTLQLIFFDGEEAFGHWTATDSLYGSRHLAERWATEPDLANSSVTRIHAIREFILLDLIGTADTVIPLQFTSTSKLYDHLVKTERHLRSNGYLTGMHPGPLFNGKEGWGKVEDDHIPFLQRGVDVVHLISSPFPSVWHQFTDDWDHLDFNLIDDFNRIFRVFVSSLLHLQPEDSVCRKPNIHREL